MALSEVVLLVELFASSAVGVYLNAALGVVAFPIITCLATILFPRVRKQLFNSPPGTTRLKIGAVPLVVVAGAIGLVGLGLITGFVVAYPQAGSPVTPSNVGFMAFMFVLGALVYFVGYSIRKREGVGISLAFKEIPPE